MGEKMKNMTLRRITDQQMVREGLGIMPQAGRISAPERLISCLRKKGRSRPAGHAGHEQGLTGQS